MNQITRYSNAKQALAEYKTVDEVKDFRDKALAIEAYAKQANDFELERDAAIARVRAERKCGELLAEMEKRKGARMNGGGVVPAVVLDDRRGLRTLIDPGRDSPDLAAYCATMDLRQRCRKFLARRHDPVEKAAAFASFQSEDLFSGLLQDYYPAQRPDESGTTVAMYVRRDQLAQFELRRVAKRLRKAGNSMIEHADALEAFAASQQGAA